MLATAAFLCLAAAFVLLCWLSVIDLRHSLLPDKLVLSFAATGIFFHFSTGFTFASPLVMAGGMLVGGGLLYSVRAVANYYYGQDALGLGDVKLLGAAGIWLGPHDVLLAVIAGALAGIVHGLAIAISDSRKTNLPMNLKALSLPAGPGFAVGIMIAGLIKFFVY